MIDKNNITDKDDKILFKKIIDKVHLCEKSHKMCFSEFLPTTKCIEFLPMIKSNHINIEIFGGYPDSERSIIGMYQSYDSLNSEDYPIDVLEITYNKKYSKNLTHRDFLGSLIGQGIDRAKIGDIILEDNKATCFISSDIGSYLTTHLDKVASSKVSVNMINIKNYTPPIKKYEEKNITIASMRLDVILGGIFNLSRSNATKLITSDKAYINSSIEKSSSKLTKEGDILSLRGYGKAKIHSIGNRTKKDKIVVTILKYI